MTIPLMLTTIKYESMTSNGLWNAIKSAETKTAACNTYNPENPRYILDLLKRIVRVSLETLKIVNELPPLEEH